MTILKNFLSGLAFALFVLGTTWAPPSIAKQTSLDARIFQAFERIDDRTNAHEQDIVSIRDRLDKLSIEMDVLRQKLATLPQDEIDQEGLALRRSLHGQLINQSAEYLNQSFRLVDSAAAVISANLSDLATLAADVRKTTDAKGDAKKLQARIDTNVAAGRSMRRALVQLRRWTQQDPALAAKFKSLRRISTALDRRIGVDKARLSGRHVDGNGAIRNRRLESLDQSVDHLGDMYTEIMSEKDALRDLRDELAIAIQLGRLEMTQEIAARAIPKVDAIQSPAVGVQSLEDMANVITTLNTSLSISQEAPVAQSAAMTVNPDPTGLEVGGFSNF
jgi:prefoldin subunit 5